MHGGTACWEASANTGVKTLSQSVPSTWKVAQMRALVSFLCALIIIADPSALKMTISALAVADCTWNIVFRWVIVPRT